MNSNGKGSIQKRTQKDGSIVYDVKYRKLDPATGKKKSTCKRGFQRKKDAQAFLDTLTDEVLETKRTHERLTISELSVQWLESYEKTGVRENTLNWHRNNLPHIRRFFEQKRLYEVKTDDIIDFITTLAGHEIKPNKKLSLTSVKNILRTLKQMFDYANEEGFLTGNPAKSKKVTALLRQMAKNEIQEPKLVLSTNEIIEFVKDGVKNVSIAYGLAIALAGLMGLRLGEIRGLTFDCLVDDTLRIYRQLDRYGNLVTLKTPYSIRTLPVHPFVRDLFVQQQNKLLNLKERYPEDYESPIELVMVHTESFHHMGQPIAKDFFGKKLALQLARQGVNGDITMHSFRHSFGSNALYAQIPVQQVSAWMGHSNPEITLNTYSHVIQSLMSSSTERYFESIDKALKL